MDWYYALIGNLGKNFSLLFFILFLLDFEKSDLNGHEV
jgi:hypothetical protein